MVELVEHLIRKGMHLKIFDPKVRMFKLIGANKWHIEEVVPHIGSLICESIEDVMRDTATVVIGLSGAGMMSKLYANSRDGQFILDPVVIPEPGNLHREYQGICW